MFSDNPLCQGTEQTPLAVVAEVETTSEGATSSTATRDRLAQQHAVTRARRTPTTGARTRTPDPTAYLRR
jgi:asparagine synthase (glutamine-hydrolysing)